MDKLKIVNYILNEFEWKKISQALTTEGYTTIPESEQKDPDNYRRRIVSKEHRTVAFLLTIGEDWGNKLGKITLSEGRNPFEENPLEDILDKFVYPD